MTTKERLVTAWLQRTAPFRLYRYAVLDSVAIARRHGLSELLRRRGWKFFAGVCAYYLIRDSLLYVVLPFCLARGLLGS